MAHFEAVPGGSKSSWRECDGIRTKVIIREGYTEENLRERER